MEIWFNISLVLFSRISLSIAVLFFALVYDDDDEDDAGLSSGDGTNLKLGGTSGTRRRKFFVVPLHFFGFTSTISRFGERFRDGHHSLVNFLFFVLLLSVPPCPVICKHGSTCPRALDRVSITFTLQFHTRKHYKTAIQSECIASQGLFSHWLRSKLRPEWYF